jgi:hypothetical protein
MLAPFLEEVRKALGLGDDGQCRLLLVVDADLLRGFNDGL